MKKTVEYALLVLLVITPLFSAEVYPAFYYSYYAAAFILIVLLKLDIFLKAGDVKKTILYIPLLLLALFTVFSALKLNFVFFRAEQVMIFFLACVFISAANLFKDEKTRKFAMYAVSTGVLFVCLNAFFQYFVGFDDLKVFIEKNAGMISDKTALGAINNNIAEKRVFSTFIYPNVFAGFLIMAMPVLLAVYGTAKKITGKIAAVLLMAIALAALIMTKSVGGMLTAAAVVYFYIMMFSKKKMKVTLSFVLLILIMLWLVSYLRPEFMLGGSQSNSFINRAEYLKDAFRMIAKAPLLGTGPGSFASYSLLDVKYPHNWYVQVTVELGIAGLGLLLWFITAFIKGSLKAIKELGKNDKVIFAGFFFSAAAFLLHNLIDIDSNIWQNSFFFFMSAGICVSYFKTGGFKLPVKPPKIDLKGKGFTVFFAAILLFAVFFAKDHMLNFTFVLCAVLVFLGVHIVKTGKLIKTKLDMVFACVIMLCVVSMLFTVNINNTVNETMRVACFIFVFYLAASRIKSALEVNSIYKAISFAALIAALFGMGQFFFKGGQASGFFPNPNLLGGFLVINIMLSMVKMNLDKEKFLTLKGISFVVSIFCLVMTGSRGAFLALTVSTMVFLVFLLLRNKTLSRPAVYRITAGVLVMTILVLVIPNPLSNRLFRMSSNDIFAFSRLDIWKSAISMFADRPVIGCGLGTFGDMWGKYNFPQNGLVAMFERQTPFAHNEYLQVAAELGIIGFILLFVFIGSIVRRLIFIGNKKHHAVVASVFIALISVATQSLVDFNMHFTPVWLIAAVLLGIIFSGMFEVKARENNLGKYRIYCSIILLCLGTGMVMNFAAETVFSRAGNYELLKNAVMLNPMNAKYQRELGLRYFAEYMGKKDSGALESSEEYLKSAVRLQPMNGTYLSDLASLHYETNRIELSLNEYKKACELYPHDPFCHAALAYSYYRMKDYRNAMEWFEKTLEIEPKYAVVRNHLGWCYVLLGDRKKGEEEIKRSYEIGGKYSFVLDSDESEYVKRLIRMPR